MGVSNFKMTHFRVGILIGTRPEAIKMAPVIDALRQTPEIDPILCVTGQHREMLSQMLEVFDLEPDFDLKIMKPGQSLSDLGIALLHGIEKFLNVSQPDLVLVHGDTSTTFYGALSCFYQKIPVAHVEAGLRSYDKFSPWPEEVNRRLTAAIAEIHFAPTDRAVENLLREGVSQEKVIKTGNTVIDALFSIERKISGNGLLAEKLRKQFEFLDLTKKLILLTVHRRENQGEGFVNIFKAIQTLSEKYCDVEFLFPVHLSPSVKDTANSMLGSLKNVYLVEPLDYVSFVYILRKTYLILTDSGGIQEEAPCFEKPVLVLRTETERRESIEANVAKLVGFDYNSIVGEASQLIDDYRIYKTMKNAKSLYGDGTASKKIVSAITDLISKKQSDRN